MNSRAHAYLNIASINKHIGDLRYLLTLLEFNWDIIGISEHKIQKGNTPLVNTDIMGYKEFIFQTTDTSFGGTGFFIRDNLDYIERPDLAFNSKGDYESMFIEIKFEGRKNLRGRYPK